MVDIIFASDDQHIKLPEIDAVRNEMMVVFWKQQVTVCCKEWRGMALHGIG